MKKFLVLPLLAATSAVFAAPANVVTATFNYAQAGRAVKLEKAGDNNEIKNLLGGGISYMRLINDNWGVKGDLNYSVGSKGKSEVGKIKQSLSNVSFGAGVVYKPLRTAYIFATISKDSYEDEFKTKVGSEEKKGKKKFDGVTLSIGASEFFKAGNNHGLTYALDYKINSKVKSNDINSIELGDTKIRDMGFNSSKNDLDKVGFRIGYAYRF